MAAAETYGKFARYYDAYVAGFSRDLPLYASLCRKEQSILEIGCGTGRVLKALLEEGYYLDGMDISLDMLAISREKLVDYLRDGSLRLSSHDMVEAPASDKYDRILITFYTFNYILETGNQVRFLRNVYKSLKDGGIVLLDLFYPQPLCRPDSADVWFEKSFLFNGSFISYRDKRRMTEGNIEERIQIYHPGNGDEEIKTYRRYFAKQEIKDMLEKAGFFDIKVTDQYDAAAFHEIAANEETFASFVVSAEK